MFFNRATGKAVIVFDVMGFVHNFGRSTIELILGGRHHFYLQEFERFLQKLRAAGATLAFFCDGQLHSEKSNVWCKRRDAEFRDAYAMINADEREKRRSHRRFGCKTIVKSLLKLIEDEKYGEVVISTQVDCDVAIAKYAVSNDALAVVANDSDFVIFEGNFQWWEASSIYLHRMQANCFERTVIRQHFALTNQVRNDILKFILIMTMTIIIHLANEVLRNDCWQRLHRRHREKQTEFR